MQSKHRKGPRFLLLITMLLGASWVSLPLLAANDRDRDGVADTEDLDPNQPRYHLGTGSIGALGFCVHDDSGLNCDGVRNSTGELISLYQPPFEASTWKDIIDYDAGWDDAACVIRSDHELICWGPKYTGAANDWLLPQVTNPVKVDVGGNYLCAIGAAGDGVHCFDPSFSSFDNYDDPADIEDFYDPDWDECERYNEDFGYCEYQRHYSPYHSFRGNKTAVNAEAMALTGVTDVSTGKRDTCAIHDGGVFCWGTRTMDVELGLSGNPPPQNYGLNVLPRALVNPRSLSLGDANACLIDDLGLVCWGTQTNRIVSEMPTEAAWSGLSNPSKVRVGNSGACVLHDNGLTCWGTGPLTLPPTGGLPQNILDFETNISGSAICVSAKDEVETISVRCWSAQNANFDHLMVGLAYGDPDGDQLNQAEELLLGTLPLDPDTDNDGLLDNVDPTPLSADNDDDGIEDTFDNCPNTANADQADMDSDGMGDVCDPDVDGDGVQDDVDNCPLIPNAAQLNFDLDDSGDVCDNDDDNDGLSDLAEIMGTLTDPLNPDTDGDGVGDNLDEFPLDPSESSDQDRDGVGDNSDNCFYVINSDQANFDGDSTGDVCDYDDDNDGVADVVDVFPFDSNEQIDTDSDGIGNNADLDDDADGVDDIIDAFPLNILESVDTDGDGVGNNADSDDDNDGRLDIDDVFPIDANEQRDTDADGIGDNADADDDNDGIPDIEDSFKDNPFIHGSSFLTSEASTVSLSSAAFQDDAKVSLKFQRFAGDGVLLKLDSMLVTITNGRLTVDGQSTDFIVQLSRWYELQIDVEETQSTITLSDNLAGTQVAVLPGKTLGEGEVSVGGVRAFISRVVISSSDSALIDWNFRGPYCRDGVSSLAFDNSGGSNHGVTSNGWVVRH